MEHVRKPATLSLVTVPMIVGVGAVMGLISNSGYGNAWFDALAKPAVMPPGWVFGLAWTILYALLGIDLALALSAQRSAARTSGITLFAIQLLLNFSWSPLFFGAHQVKLALAVIVAIFLLSLGALRRFWQFSRTAAWILIPYLAWLGFASFLNLEILLLNPGL